MPQFEIVILILTMIESQFQESPETVASHYDDLDEFYREIWGLHVHHGFWKTGKESRQEATKALIDHMLKDVHVDELKHVCDIGCGYGETARYLSSKYNSRVTGLTVSARQLEFAKTLNNDLRVKLLHRDWMNNQLPSGSFDLAMSIESSEHMPDLKKFFTEAHRVLKPGGKLKICAWLCKKRPEKWELNYLLRPICTEGRLHMGSVDEYQGLMKDSGFENLHYEDVSDQVKKTWSICIQRCAGKFLSDPKYLSFFLKAPSDNKNFLMSLIRIRLAFEIRSMNYGIFTAQKNS